MQIYSIHTCISNVDLQHTHVYFKCRSTAYTGVLDNFLHIDLHHKRVFQMIFSHIDLQHTHVFQMIFSHIDLQHTHVFQMIFSHNYYRSTPYTQMSQMMITSLVFTTNTHMFQMMITSLVFTTFGLQTDLIPNRLQLGFIISLTGVTFKLVSTQSLPKIPYLTHLVRRAFLYLYAKSFPLTH